MLSTFLLVCQFDQVFFEVCRFGQVVLGVSFKMLILWCIFYIKHSNILFYA